MRRIAIINQKGGVGKTTTCVNLGAALARLGQRVTLVDLDPQANLSLHLGVDLAGEEASTYTVLTGASPVEAALRPTATPGLSLVPSHIDLSGAELELASAIGRETLLAHALDEWERGARERFGRPPADYLLLDCPPSLGLLSVNGLAGAREVILVLQTEFFALQGLSKLLDVLQLLRRRLNPDLEICGILPCLYDGRLRLAREVLGEIRRHFGDQVFANPIRTNVKLAEAPSHGRTIFEYDPSSPGAHDHLVLAREILARQGLVPRPSPTADRGSPPESPGKQPQMTPMKPQEELRMSPADAPEEDLAEVELPRLIRATTGGQKGGLPSLPVGCEDIAPITPDPGPALAAEGEKA